LCGYVDISKKNNNLYLTIIKQKQNNNLTNT